MSKGDPILFVIGGALLLLALLGAIGAAAYLADRPLLKIPGAFAAFAGSAGAALWAWIWCKIRARRSKTEG
jgi:membrane associated rhomboid family serine protease